MVSVSAESQRADDCGRRFLLVGAGLSAIAWLVSRVVCSVGWELAKSSSTLSVNSWERWDSGNYLKIAAHGLYEQKCTTAEIYEVDARHCGTVGWLPGYPWLMRGVHAFGPSYGLAGVIIAGVALYLAIYLVWLQWGRSLTSGRALIFLLTFSLFPGCVYNFAVFPLSVTLLLCTGAIVAAIRERFVLMGVLLFAAGLCYPTAWILTVGLMIGVGFAAERSAGNDQASGFGVIGAALNRGSRLLRAEGPSTGLLRFQEWSDRNSRNLLRSVRCDGD